MTTQPPPTPCPSVEGPYRAEFGAVHRAGFSGFLFTVDPPRFAEEVAEALNATVQFASTLEAERAKTASEAHACEMLNVQDSEIDGLKERLDRAVEGLEELIPAVEAYLMSGDALAQTAKRNAWKAPLLRARSIVSSIQDLAHDGPITSADYGK